MAPKKQTKSEGEITDRQAAFNALHTEYGDIARKLPIKRVSPDEVLPTPSTLLNIATREGGIRPGSVVEWYGVEQTLKTWVAMEMVRQAQQKWPDKIAAYIDPEQALDLWTAQTKVSIDMSVSPDGIPKFVYYPSPEDDDMPDLEAMLNRMYKYAASGLFSIIILDSVAASSTLYELKADDVTDNQMMGAARVLSKSLKQIKAAAARTGTIIWCINQVRTKIVTGPFGQISKLEPGGGYALRYVASYRFSTSWAGKDKDSEDQTLKIFCEKIKYGQPWETVEVPIQFGRGIDQEVDLAKAATDAGILKKAGPWYTLPDGSKLSGDAKMGEYLKTYPEKAEELRKLTYQATILNGPDTYLPEEVDEA
jgi:recombination protein RecA